MKIAAVGVKRNEKRKYDQLVVTTVDEDEIYQTHLIYINDMHEKIANYAHFLEFGFEQVGKHINDAAAKHIHEQGKALVTNIYDKEDPLSALTKMFAKSCKDNNIDVEEMLRATKRDY